VLALPGGLHVLRRSRASSERDARVLKPAGSVALLVWGPIERCPGYERLAGCFEQQLGDAQGGAAIRAPFAYDDVAQLSPPLEAAGFEHLELTEREGRIHFNSLRDMLDLEVAGTPLAEPDQEARYIQLLQRTKPILAPWSDGDALEFPVTAFLAKAVRP
jgi:SAM-dependent methyltransferase